MSAAKIRSLARSDEDRMRGANELRRQKAEGMAFARAWRLAHRATDWQAMVEAEAGLPPRPRAALGHMPFAGHRNQAEVAADEAAERRQAA